MTVVAVVRGSVPILSDGEIPPPTAIRSVNQVISIPFLWGAGNPARPNTSSAAISPLLEPSFPESPCDGIMRGEIESAGCHRITLIRTLCLILEYRLSLLRFRIEDFVSSFR